MTHPYFGAMKWNEEFKQYEVKWKVERHSFQLNIPMEGVADQAAVLGIAQEFCKDLATWHEQAKDYAAKELLELKNDTWLDEDEKEVNATEFKKKMRLENLEIHADGNFDFWFADGDLFWGHSIIVSGNIKSGFTQAEIAG